MHGQARSGGTIGRWLVTKGVPDGRSSLLWSILSLIAAIAPVDTGDRHVATEPFITGDGLGDDE
ncbi:MAG: hypothetical protein BRD24_03575 [Halobacteriales archaeon SW_9_67_24]|nr:MAG: hypothetical protein BRD24_03575 [Halobacteriales archaeon SW_9_67_24]